MEVYHQLVTDTEGLSRAIETLSRQEFIGFDTETTELDPRDGELRLVQMAAGSNVYVIDLRQFGEHGVAALEPLRELIRAKSPVKIAHNAKFDSKWSMHHLKAEPGAVFDTYLGSQVAAAGDSDRRHSLAEAVSNFLGQELDKTQQKSDWSGELSNSQIEYAAKDAAILLPLREKIVEKLTQDELGECAELEFECVVPVAKMELTGIYLDKELWNDQIAEAAKKQAALADELQDALSAGAAQTNLFGRAEINLDSQQQVLEALQGIGIKIGDSTRHEVLESFSEKHPILKKLIEYRAQQKSLSSFGANILEYIRPETGRIHADFRQIAAPSGRFSCSHPNLQQIPQGKEYRRCFSAPVGRKLIVADYSQIELRILADFSNDLGLIRAFESGVDFHSATAAQVFGVKPEEVTAEQRAFAKRLNFGVVYGIGAARFADMTKMSENEAGNMLRRYFNTYPQLDAWLRKTAEQVMQERLVRTASGRAMRFRFDVNDSATIGGAKRAGKNMPIQGTSADILKRALRRLHDEMAGTSARLVNIVHDEIMVEADENEAADIAAKVEKAMLFAGRQYVKNAPIKVDTRVSDAWVK
jgi:DNA polymerase I-like protein with 3'-5' exonuclease and polymerase domains